MRKRLLAIIATVAMVLTMIPSMAFADSGTVIMNGTSYATLDEAIAMCTGGETITITGDWDLEAESAGSDRDMKGITIQSAEGATATITAVGTGGGFSNLNLKDLKVVDETCYTYENGENAWEFTYLEFSGNCEFTNVNFTDGVMFEGNIISDNCTFVGHNNDSSDKGNATMYGAWVSSGAAEFTGCTFTGTRGVKIHEAYGSEVKKTTLEYCFFDNLTEKPGIVIGTVNEDTAINARACIFESSVKEDGNAGGVDGIYETDTEIDIFDFEVSGFVDVELVGVIDGEEVANSSFETSVPEKMTQKDIDELTEVANEEPIEGYEFKGFFFDKDGKNPVEPNKAIEDGVTIYMIWEAVDEGTTPPADGTTTPADPTKPATGTQQTGDDFNAAVPMALAGLALAAMAAVVVTRRKQNQK